MMPPVDWSADLIIHEAAACGDDLCEGGASGAATGEQSALLSLASGDQLDPCPGTPLAPEDALSRARVLLLQADDERLGCEHSRLLDLAAEQLRAAGEDELALRVSRWGTEMTLGDVPGVLKELDGRVKA